MKIPTTATALATATAVAAMLAACGTSTPATVTLTQTGPATTTSSSTHTPTSTASASRSSTSATSTSVTTSSSAVATTSTTASTTSSVASTTSTTRTQTGPAFVGTNPSSGAAVGHDLAAAIAVLARSGYLPLSTASYEAGDTLRVLIGHRSGTSSERAFFFDQTIYLGTDASVPSQQISVLAQNDTEVTLGYGIYRSGASTPSSQRRVRFALDMGQLSPLDALPSVAERR